MPTLPDRLSGAFRTSRSLVTWAISYGFPRALIKTGARRGDLISRMEIEQGLLADPFAAYDEIRAAGPVLKGRLVAATTRHATATDVLRSDAFGVAGGHGELPRPLQRLLAAVSDPNALGPVDPPSLLAVDPPEHTRYRRLVSRVFTVKAVAAMEPLIQQVADTLLDGLAARPSDGFDLIEEYAAQLPVAVIADVLDVPESMHQRLLEWGDGAALTLDPALTWRQYRGAERDVRHLHAWFDDHVDRLRREAGHGLLARLAQMEEPDRLTDVELHATGLLLLGAGFETTVNLIGNAVSLLTEHPDQLAILQAEPDLWGNAVEEVLRYESPVQLTLRVPYSDADLGGATVRAGTPLLVMIGGANRDPAVFEDPHRFDVRRENAADHLAFSSGVHYCLGASLARLEATVALRALYERFPDLAVTGTPTRRPTRVLRGFERLPVRRVAVSAPGSR